MSNTVIQIKRSSTSAAPAGGSLTPAELAYSYVSDKLFVGSANGLDTIVIGGKFFINQQNAVYDLANAAFNVLNAAYTSANANYVVTNSAFGVVNAAYTSSNANYVLTNAAYTSLNAAYTVVNSAYTSSNANYVLTNAAYTSSNAAYVVANSAYNHANTKFASAGGTISGDVVVTGNLTISGNTTYANTQTLLIGDNIITLNNDIPVGVAPSENAGLEVKRGSSANVGLLWNEAVDRWTLTNDGSGYLQIATNTDISNTVTLASANYDLTNSAFTVLNAAYTSANANYVVTNSAFGVANAAWNMLNIAYTTVNANYTSTNAAYIVVNAAYTSVNAAYTHANGAFDRANTADLHAANASYMNTGTVPAALVTGTYSGITGVGTIGAGTWQGNIVQVPYGGTGVNTFTMNGVLYGNGAGALKVTGSGTEGQVLQVGVTGVPLFAHLDGGGF